MQDLGTQLDWAGPGPALSSRAEPTLPIHISTSGNASLARKKTHLLPAKPPSLYSQLLFIFFCFQLLMAARGKKRKKKNQRTSHNNLFQNHFHIHYNCPVQKSQGSEVSALRFLQNSGHTHSKALPKI